MNNKKEINKKVKENKIKICDLLEIIRQEILSDNFNEEKNNMNFGHVGSLGHVIEELENIKNFIKN
jgi:hypothetical protein